MPNLSKAERARREYARTLSEWKARVREIVAPTRERAVAALKAAGYPAFDKGEGWATSQYVYEGTAYLVVVHRRGGPWDYVDIGTNHNALTHYLPVLKDAGIEAEMFLPDTHKAEFPYPAFSLRVAVGPAPPRPTMQPTPGIPDMLVRKLIDQAVLIPAAEGETFEQFRARRQEFMNGNHPNNGKHPKTD
jgi:hypothetical protein